MPTRIINSDIGMLSMIAAWLSMLNISWIQIVGAVIGAVLFVSTSRGTKLKKIFEFTVSTFFGLTCADFVSKIIINFIPGDGVTIGELTGFSAAAAAAVGLSVLRKVIVHINNSSPEDINKLKKRDGHE